MSEDSMLTNGPIWSPQYLEDSVIYHDYFENREFTSDATASAIRIPNLSIGEYINDNYTLETNRYGEIVCTPYSKEDIPEMKVEENRIAMTDNYRYAVGCFNYSDLSPERILKTLSVMKSRLMIECMPVHVTNIECKMSPMVKDNIIKAYRKISMYGKKTPFVACFDEYGRRLPDEIKIDTMRGVDLKIIDPDTYGNNYLEFETIIPRQLKEDIFTIKKDPSVFDE